MPLKTNGEKPNDIQLKIHMGYLPGGPMSKNPPANAGDSCLMPGLGTKPMHHNYGAHPSRLGSATRETTATRSPSSTIESGPCLQQWRPSAAKNKLKKKKERKIQMVL